MDSSPLKLEKQNKLLSIFHTVSVLNYLMVDPYHPFPKKQIAMGEKKYLDSRLKTDFQGRKMNNWKPISFIFQCPPRRTLDTPCVTLIYSFHKYVYINQTRIIMVIK